MTPPTAKRPDDSAWILCAVVALLVALAACWTWTSRAGHGWGDDWAGYVLQAKAIDAGETLGEVRRNAVAMQGSDVMLGPDAYPWGFPAVLAALGGATDWDVAALRLVGGAALLLFCLMTYLLARACVAAPLALLVAAAVVAQPDVIMDATVIGSDIPFAALATAALLLMLRQRQTLNRGSAPELKVTAALALLCGAAFSVRFNGAVLPCAYLCAMALHAFRHPARRQTVVRDMAVFATLVAALLWIYFSAWPDGSLAQARHVSVDTQDSFRSLTYMKAILGWVPLAYFKGVAKLVVLVPMAALALYASWRRFADTEVLCIYLAGQIALLLLVPFNGGMRFYHPLLAPVFLLVAIGVQEALAALAAHRATASGLRAAGAAGAVPPPLAPQLALGLAVAVGVLQLWHAAPAARRLADPRVEQLPFAPATRAALDFVSTCAPANARIAFFKPRAFRFLTGRDAVAIGKAEHLPAVDWYVYDGASPDPHTQVNESMLRQPASDAFALVYERRPFRIYARRDPASPVERPPCASGPSVAGSSSGAQQATSGAGS